jgi:hypothetical protein
MKMKLSHLRKIPVLAALLAGAFGIQTAQATPTTFTGSYSENFDEVGSGGTAMPAGFRGMLIAGGSPDYNAANPIMPANIAVATPLSSSALNLWNAGVNGPSSSNTHLFNIGCWDSLNDRALGTDPTGVGAMVIELSMTNASGNTLQGVTFNYDCKCLTNGSAGTEEAELPGYAFFYSLTGSTNAADWIEVGYAGTINDAGGIPAAHGLCLPNFTQGTTMSSGPVTITFPTPLTNGGVMYFRWADDNNQPSSPDQQIAIDNIGIVANYLIVPTVSIASPANNANYTPGSSIPIMANATENGGTITNVEFYANGTDLGGVASTPYTFNWSSVPAGVYTLTTVASDNNGVTSTSSGVNVIVSSAAVFFGSYSQNFDAIGATGTTPPPGFLGMLIAGGSGDYTAANPILTNNIAAATFITHSNAALTIWNAGASSASSNTHLFNIGCWDSLNDRALGTDPTGVGAMVIQFSMVNATGTNLQGVTFNYDCKCLTNGSAGTEQTELPGYAFFYSLTGSSNPADWTEVGVAGNAALSNGLPAANGLCLPNYTQGTTMSSGPVTIVFPTPLTNYGTVYFRWADDNNGPSSPDQQIAIDNIGIAAYPPIGQLASITSPLNNATFIPGTNVTITANASEAGGTITNVEFFASGTDLGGAASAPYSLTWSNVSAGNYALTVVVDDAVGGAITSSVVNVTVAVPHIPPTVSLTSPANNSVFVAPASIQLSATASDTDGTVTNVAFYQGTTLLANVTTAPYNFTWTNVHGGAYALTAVATDDSGASTTSTAVNVTVPFSTVFSGTYTQDFNSIGLSGTTLPVGFRTLIIGGDSTTYNSSSPISSVGIATATVSSSQSLSVWNVGSSVTDSGSTLFNIGCWDSLNDRALGSDPTGVGGMCIELSMVNTTGNNLPGVIFSYDCKCMTNGSAGTEAGELPGYSFFYSTTGGTTAGEWTRVNALCLPNLAQGTTMSSGAVMITFPTPLTNNGTMYFRWADDNNQPNSPDQMIAIDNIAVTGYAATGPVVSIASPTPNAVYNLGANIAITANTFESGGNITNVEFFANGTDLGGVTSAPYNFTWQNPPAGTYALTAVASDSQGLSATSSVVNVIVAQAPTVSITSPANNAAFDEPAIISLSATASSPVGTVTNVAFFQGTTLLTNVATAPYSYNMNINWTNAAAALSAYALTAVATDNSGITSTSGVVNITVTNPVAFQAVQQIKTIFVIALENHDWTQKSPLSNPQQILGNPAAPYVNSLVTPGNPNSAQVSFATRYYNVGQNVHPSEPNYVWAEGGTTFGIYTDNDPSMASHNDFTAQHLTGQMNAAGVAWKTYQEDVEYSTMATISANGNRPSGTNFYNGTTAYDYTARHCPMQMYTDSQNSNVYTLTQFWMDLTNNAITRYNWITPDEFNEMHSSLPNGYNYHGVAYTGDQAAIAEGDNFLSIVIPKIMASQAYQDHGVIIIWTDETESTDDTNTTLPEIIISPLAKGDAYASSVVMSHSSDLKTMDELFGLDFQTNLPAASDLNAFGNGYNYVATANDLSDFFQGVGTSAPALAVQQNNSTLTNGATAANFGVVNVSASVTNTFTITNSGSVSLLLSNIVVAGANAGDFTVNGLTLPATVYAGQSATFNVVFSPLGAGARVATLQISDNDTNNNPFTLALNGTGVLVPPTVSLTSPANGTSFAAPAMLALSATPADIDGTVTNVAFYQGTTLLGNATSAPFTFTTANIFAGSYALTAVATDNNGLSNTSSVVNVTVTAPVLAVQQSGSTLANGGSAAAFGAVNIGANATEVFTVTNTGNDTLILSNIVATGANAGDFTVSGITLPAMVFAGQSTTFNVVFAPLGAGTRAATLQISDNDVNNNPFTLALTGTGVLVPPTVSLTAPASGASFAAPAMLALTATAADIDGTVTNVAFYQGTTLLGNAKNAPFTFTTANIFTGSYALTAVATDNNGLSSTSGVVNITVTNTATLAVLQSIKMVFIIAMENHDLVQKNPTGSPQQIQGNPAAPYFNSLITPGNPNAAQTAWTPHMFSCAINGEHPSEPNYIWQEAGTDFGIRTDDDPNAKTTSHNVFTNVMHLSGQLNAAGISWKTYQEDVEYSSSEEVSVSGSGKPVNVYNGTTQYNYGVKHNPMAFFPDTQNQNCYPMTNFWTDLANTNVGRYNWITPDQYNEWHSALSGGYNYYGVQYTGDQAAIASGDNALSIIIPKIMASQAYKDHGVIIIWTDETESTDDTNSTLPYVIISPLCKGNAYVSTLPYSHSSDLKTMDEIFGLAYQTNAIPAAYYDAQNDGLYNYVDGHSAKINDLSDFFKGVGSDVPMLTVLQNGTTLTNGASATSFGAVSLFSDVTEVFTITNTGNATLVVSNVVATGVDADDFTVTGLIQPATLAVGQSISFNVIFSPLDSGSRTAILQINDNDASNNPFTLSLTGTGVDEPPTVVLTAPANGAKFAAPANLTISAGASDLYGAITNVAFYQGTNLLGNATSAPFTFTTANVFAGSYALTAVATDDSGAVATSSVVNVTVTNTAVLNVLQSIKTVFIIAMENHDLVQKNPTGNPQQILGNPAAPYFNSLITPGNPNAAQTAWATHMFSCAINGEHPSEPNYIWAEAGTDFGVRSDNDPNASGSVHNVYTNVMHLSAQLTAAGVAWRSYQEDLEFTTSEETSKSGSTTVVNPYNGTKQYNYGVKHNPMAFFNDTQNQYCYPMTNFWTDLTNNNIGRYNWITPDQYNEWHSALSGNYTYNGTNWTGDQSAIASGDNALSIIIPKIMASAAYQDHGVIIIWTDETESTDDTNTTLPYVIISPLCKGNAYASTLPYNHSSDLKTMDEIFGLAYQTNAIPAAYYDAQNDGKYDYVDGHSAPINDLSDFFQGVGMTITNQPVSVTANAGTTAGFNIGATAPTPLNYQWYFGTNLLAGQTNSALSIGSVGPTNVGSYYVVVNSGSGSANSALATLTVIYQAPNVVGGQMMLGAGGFQLNFSGPSGQTYKVIASDDLTTPQSAWPVISTGTFNGGNVSFTDPDAVNHPHRYYVVKSP